MNKFKRFLATISVLLLVGCCASCGTIEDGHVGVVTTWTGEVLPQELSQGFYTAITSSVDEYVAKEISVEVFDLQPKAADNLTLADLDMEVFYRIDPTMVAETKIKYSGRDVYQYGLHYPAYKLIYSYTRSAIYETVAKFQSLEIHRNRNVIASDIMAKLQEQLDTDDPGLFTITKVVVRDVKTDPSIEESIKLAVSMNKKLEAKAIELDVATKQEEINRVLDRSLTPAVLKQRELDVQLQAIENGATVNLFLGTGVTPIVNMK